jgi:hypothetical protein
MIARTDGSAGAVRRREEAVHRAAQLVGVARVRAARVRRRARRRRAELRLERRLPLREARRVEEAVLVEARDDALDLRGRDETPVLAHDDRLHVDERVLAVEHRDDLEQRPGQEHDRGGDARRIAQRDDALPLVLHGKRLDVAETRQRLAHAPR